MVSTQISGCMLQPVVRVASGEVLYREMLVRFSDGLHVQQTILVAEAAGYVHTIDLAVLERAASALEGNNLMVVAVNISPHTVLYHSGKVFNLLERYCVDVGRLVIEITETAPVLETSSLGQFAERIRQLGGKIAVDDFGHGFCDAVRVELVRPDYLKMPKSGAYGWANLAGSGLAHVRKLAGDVGAAIIAEGVETAMDAETLATLGIEAGQGYLYGRPYGVRLEPATARMQSTNPASQNAVSQFA